MMSKPIGRVTYERRYVIVQVPEDWKSGDPLPPASADDQWFDSSSKFEAALDAPYDRRPINRRPLDASRPSQASEGTQD